MKNNYEAQIEHSIGLLFDLLATRVTNEELIRMRAGFEFARKAHEGQTRKSGEPYIIHPIAVATILAQELELSDNTVIAAFLHDVVEDTKYTIEDIREHFGDDVAKLVDAVTKRKKEKYRHSKQVDNYRQILESVHYDVRALLIKLADRLHNMRTLDSMSAAKQMKIAGETDYFYAPLANRLGLYHIKTELENLSFHYRCPSDYSKVEEQLREEREEERQTLDKFVAKIDSILREAGYNVRTEIRYREPYSVWRKMKANNSDIYHIDGKHYIRIIYSSHEGISDKTMCLKIYSVLTDHFKEKPCSVCNYIDTPKENGYQSFHVKLINEQGDWEEIHISSESMVRNSRLGCAAERSETSLSSWLNKFKEILEKVAASDNHDLDFMEGVTSAFYNDDIMVFTPKGRGVILPKGATALDFAFEIHSKVGEKAVYARINRKLMSLRTVLQRGDRVEIGTAEDAKPDIEWLDHVYTFRAKRYLRSYFANLPRLKYKRCPLCHPLPEDEVIGYLEDNETTLHKRDCPEIIRLASENGDAIVSATFNEDPNFLYPVRIRIQGIDRYHLMSDLIDCITNKLQLTMSSLKTENIDRIAICTIDFAVHSVSELKMVMSSISHIDGIDEVTHISM